MILGTGDEMRRNEACRAGFRDPRSRPFVELWDVAGLTCSSLPWVISSSAWDETQFVSGWES